MFDNTNLMDMTQYKLVNASNWASKAFTLNPSLVPDEVAA
jgi:hypothetical protein